MMPERLAPRARFTTMQKLVAILVGRGQSYDEIASRLSVKRSTIKYHAENAAAKLPGVDPPRMKLTLWWRHATEEQMSPRSER